MRRHLTLLALLAASFVATDSAWAQDQTGNRATSLLELMRVDDQFSAQIKAVLKLRCAAAPEERREECRKRGSELVQDIDDHKQMAQLMTPYVERTYADQEIAEMARSFSSPDGKVFTEVIVLASYYRIDREALPPKKPIDAETQRAWETFSQSSVGRKYFGSVAEYRQELEKQSSSYFCTILERHGDSCAALGASRGGSK